VHTFVKDNRGQLKANVDDLADITQVLVDQRRALAETFDIVPLATDNVLKAYNPKTRTLDGRGNLNELSMGGSIVIPEQETGTEGLVPVPESRAEELPEVPLPPVGDIYGTPEKKGAGQ
jgi:ABC-type transporter Mla subunit MlaD